MYFGLAYYPEHWPEERWPLDARMMQEAHVNGVRMGEFAWSKLEPREGVYDFAWLDRAIELLAQHGIKTMMCTCSRNPPPWVFYKYPGIRNVRADRQQSNNGFRYTVCHNNADFVTLSQRIDRAVIEHYAGNPNVIAWHIDNEIGSGNTCYCDTCRTRFHEHLEEKYGTVDNLNAKWGSHFWSIAYTTFDEVSVPVGIPMPYPSLALEYARFQSKVNSEFARWRYDLIKKLCPSAWVTTNFQGSRATHTDIFELGAATDIYGTNLYPSIHPEFSLDYGRGKRGELIVLEQQSGGPHWRPGTPPGWMRLWTYRSIAHGATGINYFRWRTARWGQEEYWHGVLPHSGQPNRRYQELKETGAELDRIGELIAATRPAGKVAIALSYESRWAVASVASTQLLTTAYGTDALDPHEDAKALHTALMEQNIPTDALDPREDLSAYRLVLASRLYIVDERTSANLRHFVENGGILVLTPRSGVADEYNVIFDRPAPGPLSKIAGVEVDDYTTLEGDVAIEALANGPRDVVQGTVWADEINLVGAEVAARFSSGWMAGMPAITVHSFGRGKVVYLGTLLRGTNLDALVTWLTELAGVRGCLVTPPGVRAYERQGKDYRLLFVLNFSEQHQHFSLGESWQELLSDQEVSQLELPPAGVAVLKGTK